MQTGSGSTQERRGNDRHCLTSDMKGQMSQFREWLLHCGQNVFRLGEAWNPDIDSTYAIVVLEYRKDVVHSPRFFSIFPYKDRQGWPNVQHLPRWFSGCAVKLQIQATRRPKNNVPPLSAHVNQCLPRLSVCVDEIEIKYV